jgi:type I restriction enzyme, S subunit
VNGAEHSERASALKRFRQYPAYKHSDVEWLGEIPTHWKTLALKRVVDPARPVTYGIVQCGPDYPDGIKYIRPVDMSDEGGVDADALQRTAPEIAASYARSAVRPGDVVVSIGPSFGKAMVVPPELDGANLTQGTARVAPGQDIAPRFLFWILRSNASFQAWDSYCSGATFRALTLEILETCEVTLPSAAEQRAIAAFLDRETARTDALVAKKERLIELLQEKRKALIARAVTKGLDPQVPTKDSGVEWLGEIPAHWESGALRRFWSVIDCKHRTAVYVEQGLPIVSTTEVKPGRLVLDGPRKITQEDFADLTGGGRRPRRGDIIYSRNASVGAAAYVETDEPFCMGQDVCLITSERDQLYLAYQLNSRVVMGQIEAVSVGSTFERINVAQIKSFDVACPPMTEQRAIAAFLDRETTRIDALVEKVREAIERLKELRTALISAAVTGKIDVREEAA